MEELLKTLAKQSANLTKAVERQLDLMERGNGADGNLAEIIDEMAMQVVATLTQLGRTKVRIAPEQIEADTTLRNALKNSLAEWQKELSDVERDLLEQAIIDSKQGQRSNRYVVLEKREKDLKEHIIEAKAKLGAVSERIIYSDPDVQSENFTHQVNSIVKNAKA